jgi:Spy/CpxP family protein refolding chaperone
MSKKLITIVAAIALVGIGTFAYAHWSGDWGHHGRMHGGGYGYGMPHGYYGNPGYGDLSEDQVQALEKERNAFYRETEMIREDLYAQQLALQSELSKSDPDTAKAAELQKDISELESKLDQKRVDHMIKIGKIRPDAGRGFAMRGPMMGYGGQYPGACWQ